MPDAKKMVDIMGQVAAERHRQDHLWGEQNHDPFKWMAILGEEVGEANKAALESYFNPNQKWNYVQLLELRTELIQVAAVACSVVECLDRGKWATPQPTEPTKHD